MWSKVALQIEMYTPAPMSAVLFVKTQFITLLVAAVYIPPPCMSLYRSTSPCLSAQPRQILPKRGEQGVGRATTKTLTGLLNHLMLYVGWLNGYAIT